ncbi:MAG: lysoplasmalogenase [Myxococcales bacterium]|nr:lysoplasmalogenase [Myxococcales bacterium]
MNSLYWTAVAVTSVATAVLLVAEHRESPTLKWIAKPIASLGFIAAALAVGATGHLYGQIVLAGLCLSMLGDVLLIPSSTGGAFLGGVGAFLLAHVAYAVAFLVAGVDWRFVAGGAVAFFAFGFFFGRWIVPQAPPRLRLPVVAYILVICSMASLAVGVYGHFGGGWLVPAAATCFVVSDISVAMDRFAGASFIHRAWGLPLYFGAQLLFAATCVGGGA